MNERVRLQPTLPADTYRSADVYAREREVLWFRQWVLVGRAEEVAAVGDRLLIDVVGESILVVRGDDGLRGFYNVCRHRGAELVNTVSGPGGADDGKEGALRCGSVGALIRCPYHAWSYGLDGALRRAPFLDADAVDELSGLALRPVWVDTWGGFVFVNLSEVEPKPLMTGLAAMAERVARYPLADLRIGLTLRYDLAANWKILAENYNECYHCGPVHPELCDLVPTFRRGGGGLDWPDGIPHRDGAWTFTESGTTNRAPFATLDAVERTRHKGELVYPNLLLSLSADHVAAFRIEPVGPSRTRVVCDLLFEPAAIAAPDFDPTDAGNFWDMVNLQDWAICASVQRGMSSRGWRGGWLAPMEDDSADILRWYERMMEQQP